MLRQSTLLGSFLINEKVNGKTHDFSADPGISNKHSLENTLKSTKYAAGGEINNECAKQTITKSKQFPNVDQNDSQETVMVNGAFEKNQNNQKVKQEDVVRTPNSKKKKSNGKLSLSYKENGSMLSKGLPQERTETGKASHVVAYSDFLAEMSGAAKPPSETSFNKCEKITEKREKEKPKNEKPTMSYSDFLNMFKPAPAETDSPKEDVSEVSAVDGSNQMAAVQCRSILSFFSKSTAIEKSRKSSESNSVKVIAEVHDGKESVKLKILPSPLKGNLPTVIPQVPNDVDAIEYLGSEMVKEESMTDNMSTSKKRKTNIESCQMAQSKKLKVSDNDDRKSTDLSLSICQSNQNDCYEDSPVVSNMTSQLSIKTSQSQLSFGMGVLAISKAKPEEKAGAVEKDQSEKRKRGRLRKVSDVIVSREQNSTDNSESCSAQVTISIRAKPEIKDKPEAVEKEQSEKGKQGRPRKVSDVIVSKENSECCSAQVTTSKSKNNTETLENTPLRRSSRTSRPVKPFMINEIVQIDDDEEEEEEKEEKDKKSKDGHIQRKKKGDCDAQKIDAPSSKKKTKGPLAPIFTSMKLKEESKPPPEDPEKVRLRREFMMSGIPEELKRQITTNVFNVILDYPPLPNPSHTQQLDRESYNFSTNKAVPVAINGSKNKALQLDPYLEAYPSWENLEWDATMISNSTLLLQPCQTSPILSQSQQKELLAKWHQEDPTFKFDRTLNQLLKHLKTPDDVSYDSTKTSLSSSEDDVVIMDDSTSEKPVKEAARSNPNVCLWPDLHQPVRSEEIVGNGAVLEQLKDWLGEWKKIMQKDIRKACKRSASQPNKSKRKGCWSDDSDFTNSEEEDELLCNTMLMTGPHGVGKTASVYALAQEMGYKVFEVNSSTLRSGKQLLSQLEEATQSHRVAPSKSRQHPPEERVLSAAGSSESKKATSKSMATAFAALFQTSGQQTGTALSTAKSKTAKKSKPLQKADIQKETPVTFSPEASSKKRKISSSTMKSKNSVKNSTSSKSSKKNEDKCACDKEEKDTSQNLATMSLILFDEVDVVFEEDKGFLSTIEHFMASTKIPIILTSTAPASSLELSSKLDHIVFKYPTMASSVSYLCCVSLAHGVPATRHSIAELWQLLGGDLRRCLLYLQFWCQSGGGRGCLDKSPFHNNKLTSVPDVASVVVTFSQDSNSSISLYGDIHENDCSDDSNSNQFLSLRRPARKARRMIVDDDEDEENSNSSHDIVEKVDSDSLKSETSSHLNKRKRFPTKRSFAKVANRVCGKEMESTVSSVTVNHDLTTVAVTSSQGDADEKASTGFYLHLGLAESFLGVGNEPLSSQTIGQFIQSSTLSRSMLDRAVQVVTTADRILACNSIYQLGLHFSSVPKCDKIKVQLTLSAPSSKFCKRKRILDRSWLDSDCSEDESKIDSDLRKMNEEENDIGDKNNLRSDKVFPYNPSEMELSCEVEHSNLSLQNEDKTLVGESGVLDQPKAARTIKSKACLAMLSSLSQYYDSVSALDTLNIFYSSEEKGMQLCPGTSDEDTSSATSTHYFGSVLQSELPATANLLASRTLCKALDENEMAWQDKNLQSGQANCDGSDSSSWPDELCLPIGKSVPELWGLGDRDQRRSFDSATKNVVNCLGATVLQSDPVVYLDYLPHLRDVCRSENLRHLAKTQRRFHHYLDNAGMSLKKSTIACLTSTFTLDNPR